MSLKFNVKKFVHANTPQDGKYYARATMTDEMDLFAVAEEIQRNCSLKKSDVVAVLTELVDVLTESLQDSKKVRLNGLGTFKMALSSRLVDSVDEVSANNIKGYRILFTPEYKKNASGKHIVALTKGASAEPLGRVKRKKKE